MKLAMLLRAVALPVVVLRSAFALEVVRSLRGNVKKANLTIWRQPTFVGPGQFMNDPRLNQQVVNPGFFDNYQWSYNGASGGDMNSPYHSSDQATNGYRPGDEQHSRSLETARMMSGNAYESPDADCHPKCWWSCGNSDCDEVCDPVCAPPQCETACKPINLATCQQVCDEPACAVVCPSTRCEHGDCPQCKPICGPPKCRTECAEQCETKCNEPQCTWKCNPGQCPEPKCNLVCGGAKMCGFNKDINKRPPPFPEGMTVLAKGLAALDPSTLGALQAAGAPAPAGPAAPMGVTPVLAASAPGAAAAPVVPPPVVVNAAAPSPTPVAAPAPAR
mmetsp:Transcript_1394/g.3775  ORF Transcript_1394/g.3775 Transcript_1394/m.3775 type:complete len:333 (-) Transcript_1394:22-1020(-)